MSEDIKSSCQYCEGHILFPREYIGQSIACPHCARQIVLNPPDAGPGQIPTGKRAHIVTFILRQKLFMAIGAFIILALTTSVLYWQNHKIVYLNTTTMSDSGKENGSLSEIQNRKQHETYSPTHFINKFGGCIASEVKDILGPPDEVSGNEWCYHNIIYNSDTEKLDNVWIDFEQKPDYPYVVIQVVAIRVSGNTYTWRRN